ncbi:helix-turn-helix domain-containing protein [Paenarthrobacter sp. NPDC090522]|uniref:helix-turn-helix domain-containing protein n=1 Tax=Paenarthrobacter sp. NPDC090522 TaxID=3364383 RepID=UPI00380C452D
MEKTEVARLVALTGLSKQVVATAIGTSVASLRRWERGDSIPDDKRAELISLAGGDRPAPTSPRKIPAAHLAQFPSHMLIEEPARRSQGGTLRDA